MNKIIKINEKFRPLYEEKTRYYIITGERGASKSFTVADYLTRKLYQEKQIIYFTRFTMESAKDSIIPEFREKLELLNCENHFYINKLDITNLLSKSEIKFRGVKASQGSQTSKLKGLTGATVWVIDEAEEFTDESLFDKLDKSLRVKDQNNIVIFILNPTYKKHFIYKRFFRDKGVEENYNGIKDNVCYIHMTWKDNKENLDQDFINDALRLEKENPEKYKKVYTTGWLNPEDGLLYPKFKTFKDVEFSKENIRVAYIDTADEGKDFYSMPIVEIIGNKVYLIDVIYNQSRLTILEPLTISKINDLLIDTVIVETNKEGSLYIGNLKKQTKSNILGIKNSVKKETRILSQAGWLLDNLLIKEPVHQNKEYRKFISDTLEYEINPHEKQHDDAPDSLSGLAKYLRIKLKL